MSYCDFCKSGRAHEVHVTYHDTEYGFPSQDDHILFERLVLEINQAGLSWETILKKREGFSRAYDNFNLKTVANYGSADLERLLSDSSIIRNRLKIQAAIYNAEVILNLIEQHGSFHNWILLHHPLSRDAWVKIFKKTFRFTGGEIVNEFLMSLGYLPGAHDSDCFIHQKILALNPPFAIQ